MAQPLQTFDLGRTLGQAQNIVNARTQNKLARQELNPNSLNNRYKQAQINSLNDPSSGYDPTAPMRNYAERQRMVEMGATPQELAIYDNYVRAQQVKTIGGVETIVGPGGLNNNPLSTLQAEGEAGAYLKNVETSGGLDAQGGIRYNTPVTSADVNLGVQGPTQAAAAPQQPVSAASLAADQTTATEQAKATVKQEVEQKKNAKAYNTYVVARENLRNALKGTKTGYFSGKLPAVGAAAQIADNAQKIIFPAIKSLVREAGEGIFTDRDAIDVQAMLPTRETHPDALPAVMYNIDSYVASKLGQPPPPIPDGMVERPDWIGEKDHRWNQLSNEQKMEIIRARSE